MRREDQPPEMREMYAQRALARKKAKAEKRKAQRMGERQSIPPQISKTCPSYRRRLAPLREMVSKSDLREFLAEAVRNTEGAR